MEGALPSSILLRIDLFHSASLHYYSFCRTEVQEKCLRLQSEAEQALQQLEQAELKASAALKQAATAGAQHAEAQVRSAA